MNRVFWLDAVRAFAIILVVFTHAHEYAGVKDPLLNSIFYSVDRIGVPLFFMISGGLILSRLSDCNILSFYKKKLPRFIILLFVWAVITNTFKFLSSGAGLEQSIIKAIIEHNGIYPFDFGGAYQLWFMYAIIQLYLIAPFLSKLLSKSSNSEVIIFLIICLFFNQFKMTVTLNGGPWGALWWMGSDLTGANICYFIVGYLIINRGIFSGDGIRHAFIYAAVTLISVAIQVYIDHVSGGFNKKLHWYGNSIFIFTSGVGCLLLLRSVFISANSFVLSFISNHSFGIYLSHYAIIYFVSYAIGNKMDALSEIVVTLICFVVAFCLSLSLSAIASKGRFTRWIVA